jgi:hypothetical protein
VNWLGPLLGIFTLLAIGLGFAWVIRAEHRFGWQWWPYFTGAGLLLLAFSLFMPTFLTSALLGIIGASLVWGATELPEQAERASKGWFKQNPNPKPRPPFADRIERWPKPKL